LLLQFQQRRGGNFCHIVLIRPLILTRARLHI
jgi:hypothetical protein